MQARSFRWLFAAVKALTTRPPLGYLEEPVDETHLRRIPIWPNRLQAELFGSKQQ